MQISQVLVAHGLVSADDVNAAVQHQRTNGGRLDQHLVELGYIDEGAIQSVLSKVPETPRTIRDTGISMNQLNRLLLKAIFVDGIELPSLMAHRLKLSANLVIGILRDAVDKRLVENLGPSNVANSTEERFVLTTHGRQSAAEALAQNQYIGPTPVSLKTYADQIMRQKMANERVDRAAVVEAFSDMVVTDHMINKLGPAVNSSSSILLYGAPGNGKTSIAERLGAIFPDIVYIPYCVEVEGQIIKVFDPSIHQMIEAEPGAAAIGSIRAEQLDARWVPCRRPVIITGGELTLEMLDLQFSTDAKFYEAPLHLKALNGTFIIDDFGRQLVRPTDLLNRWIVPLESRVDYLKLHTGKSFMVPFDEIVIFSTNMEPDDLMDPAFLRRIPYKLEIPGPTEDNYRVIFEAVAGKRGVQIQPGVLDYVIEELQVRSGQPLACYQPKFIVEQVFAACKFAGEQPVLTRELVAEALTNLFTKTAGMTAAAA
ncbi:MAG: ATPase [Pseudomonadota bacterium]